MLVRKFIASLCKHWLTLMGSAAFTILSIYADWRKETGAWVVASSAVIAIALFMAAAFRAWREEHNKVQRLMEAEGPDVVVEYTYTDEDTTHPSDASRPLFLVNTSREHVAKNVRLLPLSVGNLNATFDPDVIPYIEAGGRQAVRVVIADIFPTLRHDFPILFSRNSRDTGQEPLSELPYQLLVDYEDSTGARSFRATVTLLYRERKRCIRVGEIHRRLLEPGS